MLRKWTILLLICMFLLTACFNQIKIGEQFDGEVNFLDGVTMTVVEETAYPEGISIEVVNTTVKEIGSGNSSDYNLQVERDGKWYWLKEHGSFTVTVKLLNDMQKFDELLGRDGKLFLLVDGEMLVSFETLTHQDCIRDKSIFPWLGFLFTYPVYRGNRYSEKLLKYVEEEAKSDNHSIVYLGTDHTELYEKYGYTYMETRKDYWNDETRIYYKEL